MGVELAKELENHTGTLIVLVGFMSGTIGVLVGALASYAWKRIGRMEERQSDLREKVLPQLITKEDFNRGIETLQTIGQAFVARVESFMTTCSEGKCFMARVVQFYHAERGTGNNCNCDPHSPSEPK